MAALEQRSRAGDTTHDLYSQYGKQIYSYCLHKLRSKEEAEDAVQTTFMNAFRSLQRGATTQFEQAWLFKIAQNVCVARATSSSRRLRLEAPNDFEVLQEVVPAREGDGELELIGIEEALEQMPENQRRAILLREWQGLSYREISEELGLSQAAVEMLIFRARRALAGALEQPEEARARSGKVARRAGSFASLVAGALKTLLGGGAAIKAVTIAAAAVAVVGESGAQHTIVRPRYAPVARHAAAKLSAAKQVPQAMPAPRVVAMRTTAQAHSAVRVAPVRRVITHFSPARVAPVARHAAPTTPRVKPVAPAAAPAAPAPAAEPAPAQPAAAAVPAPPPPAAEKPFVAPVAPAPQAPVQETVVQQPAPAPPADPGNGANDRDRGDHGKPADPPPPAPAAPVQTVTAPPADSANGSGNGNGNANGNGNGNAFGTDKDHGKPADTGNKKP